MANSFGQLWQSEMTLKAYFSVSDPTIQAGYEYLCANAIAIVASSPNSIELGRYACLASKTDNGKDRSQRSIILHLRMES